MTECLVKSVGSDFAHERQNVALPGTDNATIGANHHDRRVLDDVVQAGHRHPIASINVHNLQFPAVLAGLVVVNEILDKATVF